MKGVLCDDVMVVVMVFVGGDITSAAVIDTDNKTLSPLPPSLP